MCQNQYANGSNVSAVCLGVCFVVAFAFTFARQDEKATKNVILLTLDSCIFVAFLC